jgi:nitrogen fixation protein NifU and related proteins
MTDDLYRETIVTEARHPQNYGPLEGADISQSYINPSCGDSINVYVKLDLGKKKIIDISWEGNGCVVSMASMSFLSAKVKGMSLTDINKMTPDDLQKILGVEEITPSREKCMMMGLMAIQKAIKDN